MKKSIQELMADYLIEEGEYHSNNYPQNIEIISSVKDSLNYIIRDPRILLISDNVSREDIDHYKRKINAIKGVLTSNHTIKLPNQYNLLQDDQLYRRRMISTYLKEYPELNDNAAIIGIYDWTIEGMEQIFTLLPNLTQDYYIGFGIDIDDPDYRKKMLLTNSYVKELIDETDGLYEGLHDRYLDTELYLVKKKPKIKTLIK